MKIQTLFFDAKGRGPDPILLEPFNVPGEGAPLLLLRIDRSAHPLPSLAVLGGLQLDREGVVELHAELAAWLEAHR